MSISEQPASLEASPELLYRHRRPRRRRALAVAVALTAVLVVAGASRAGDSHVVSFLSAGRLGSNSTSDSASVASSVTGAMVDIVSTEAYQNQTAAGTGMILSSTGEILTNNHVIDGATSIKVTVVSTGRTYTASVVGTDPTEDIAVLQLAGASGLKTIPIGDSSAVKVGQKVVARGNAGGVGGAPSVVTGTVTALNQSITASDGSGSNAEQLTGLIQTNAPIVAGDSGGPLATTSGKVIGIDTAASANNQSMANNQSTADTQSTADSQGFAIPIQTALTIAQKIEAGQASSTIHIGVHGFLGVELQEQSTFGGGFGGGFDGNGGNGLGGTSGTTTSGALIAGVMESGAAAKAGLEAGDVITSVNGRTVDSATTLNTIMASTKPGQKVTLGWTDISGQSHTAKVALGTAAAD
jgi:S1-C subfamily serine protease